MVSPVRLERCTEGSTRFTIRLIGTKSRYVTVLLRDIGIRPVADPAILPGYRGSLYLRIEVPCNLAARREAAFPRRKDSRA